MKQFKEFNLKPVYKSFIGDKIRIDRVLNKEIVVHDFKIENSKFDKGNGKCLHMQISVGDTKHVLFTGSAVLMELIEKVPREELPFKTIIVKENERFEFT